MLVAGASKIAQLFDVSTGSELATQMCDDRVRTAVLGRDGEVMATGGFDMTVRVSDVYRLVVGEHTAWLLSASCCFLLLPVSPARV